MFENKVVFHSTEVLLRSYFSGQQSCSQLPVPAKNAISILHAPKYS